MLLNYDANKILALSIHVVNCPTPLKSTLDTLSKPPDLMQILTKAIVVSKAEQRLKALDKDMMLNIRCQYYPFF